MDTRAKKNRFGIISMLTILFILLKCLGIISWSWIWIFSPIWVSALLIFAVFSAILIGGRIKKGQW